MQHSIIVILEGLKGMPHAVLGRAETSLILLSLAAALRFVYRFWTDGRRYAQTAHD